MTRPTTVAVIGAGRVGTALAVLLQRAGHPITAASGRDGSRERAARYLPGVPFFPLERAGEAARRARVVLLSVADDAVAPVCGALAGGGAFGPGRFAVHLSGSLRLDVLQPAADQGAGVLSVHPLQSFPTVERGIQAFPGSGAAVTATDEEGFGLGEVLVRDAGGRPFRLADRSKPLYHAAAVFCANYLVAVEAMAERLFVAAGVPDPLPLFAPLARAVLDRALAEGPGAALTGPAVRGDAGTMARNLEALAEHAPQAVAPYVAMARVAAALAAEGGHLSPEGRERVEEVLARWG